MCNKNAKNAKSARMQKIAKDMLNRCTADAKYMHNRC